MPLTWQPARVADVLLLHSALGLRPAVLADADLLRRLGHHVVAPDLYEGEQFTDSTQALRHLDGVGRDVVRNRAQEAANKIAPGAVYAGYSMGAGIAQWLVESRRDAAGAILISNANPPATKRYRVPIQVHVAHQDQWIVRDHLQLLTAAGADIHSYSGGHLFTDPDLPDYDAGSSALTWLRVAELLSQLRSTQKQPQRRVDDHR